MLTSASSARRPCGSSSLPSRRRNRSDRDERQRPPGDCRQGPRQLWPWNPLAVAARGALNAGLRGVVQADLDDPVDQLLERVDGALVVRGRIQVEQAERIDRLEARLRQYENGTVQK